MIANTTTPRPARRARRGMTAVIAIIYLGLFSTLAVAFYQSTVLSVKVVSNDREAVMALAAAESGMQFVKYQLGNVTVPPTHTQPEVVVQDVLDDLVARLSDSRDMDGLSVARDGLVITLPADAGASIPLGGASTGASFRATIAALPGGDTSVRATVTGLYGGTSLTRTVTLDYARQQVPSTLYQYAVASKGAIVLAKGEVTSADPAQSDTIDAMSAKEGSATAVSVTGGTLGGDLTIMSSSDIYFRRGSVGGNTTQGSVDADTTRVPVGPEFPVVDTSPYQAYAVNAYVAGAKTQKNILIRPNTNPRFNGGDTVQGIMFVQSPNTVTMNGNFNMAGIIVFENKPGANALNFSGNMSQTTVPDGAEFDSVRGATNISILAPTASVSMTGSTASYLRGSLIVDTFAFNGAADVRIDRGTLITLNEGDNSAVFSGSKSVKFTATGAGNAPTVGISYSSFFAPRGESYQELVQ